MSSLSVAVRIVAATLMVLAAPLTPRGAAAQASATSRTLINAYRARRDALLKRDTAEHRVADREATVGRQGFNVAVKRGKLSLLTSSAMADTAHRALTVADSLLRLTLFYDASPTTATFRLHPNWSAPAADSGRRRMWMLDSVSANGAERFLEYWQAPPSAEQLAGVVVAREQQRMGAMLPLNVRDWLNSSVMRRDLDDRWATVYVKLATSRTVVSRSCLLGSIPACRQVLRLEQPADPLMEWFTPSARRALVEPIAKGDRADVRARIDSALPGALTACVRDRDDAACVPIIRGYLGITNYGDPLESPSGREALMIAASSFDRAPGLKAILRRDALTPSEAIEAMSGTTVDAVVDRWIRRVAKSEPERVQLPAPRLLSAVAWIMLIGAVSLGGSRWRSV